MRMLEHAGLKCKNSFLPYYYMVESDAKTVAELRTRLHEICAEPPVASALPEPLLGPCAKYAPYLPKDLLLQAKALDYTDIAGAIESMKTL